MNDAEFGEQVLWEKKVYQEDDVILRESDSGKEIYVMLRGEAHVVAPVVMGKDEESSGLAKLVENDVFGELSLFEERPRSATVIAAGDCEIAVIDGPSLVKFMDASPQKGYYILRDIFNQVVRRLRQNNIRTSAVLELYLRECGN